MSEDMSADRTSKDSIIDVTSYPGLSRPLESSVKPRIRLDGQTSQSDTLDSTLLKNESHDPNWNRSHVKKEENRFELDWIDCQNNNAAIISNQSSEYPSYSKVSNQSKNKLSISGSISRKPSNHTNKHTMASEQQFYNQLSDRNDSSVIMIDDQLIDAVSADYNLEGSNLDGQLADRTADTKYIVPDDLNHLDEPILDTLVRDLMGIYQKMKIIALPLSSYDIYKVVLRGWDLWGPLLLCTFLAFNLHHSGTDNHVGPHFADVFVLVWFGSCIVSLNYRLLSVADRSCQQAAKNSSPRLGPGRGDNIRGDAVNKTEGLIEDNHNPVLSPYEVPFQSLIAPPSVLQLMCVLGYCLVAPCLGVLILKIIAFNSLLLERIIIGLIFGFAWPTLSSVRVLIRYQSPEKKALAIYPIGLFYFVLSCMIILNH